MRHDKEKREERKRETKTVKLDKWSYNLVITQNLKTIKFYVYLVKHYKLTKSEYILL